MSIELVVGINNCNKKHLDEVIQDMKKIGSPTLRAIKVGELLLILEGSHRLEAAKILNLQTKIEILSKNTKIDFDNCDIDNNDIYDCETYADMIPFIGNGNEYQFNNVDFDIID